jgi:hypothetical protein
MSGLVNHTIGVAQVKVASGQVANIEIDKIAPGVVQVDGLSLENTSLEISSGTALLQSVRFLLQLQFTLTYWYNLGFGISGSGSDNLGSIAIPFNAGDVLVPTLNNISLNIPSVAATNVSANIAPIVNLALGSAGFGGIDADTITLPSAGFQLGGLGLGPVSVGSVQVPNALVGKVSIAEFKPTGNVVVPSVQLNNIQFPSASAADISSAAPIAINNIATSPQGVSADLGIFGVGIMVSPVINTFIGSLVLSGVSISGSVTTAEIHNISVPIVISGINLETITIGAIDVNSITL